MLKADAQPPAPEGRLVQKKVVSVETVCDVCGEVINDTEPSVPLGYDGGQYLIDLCSRHKKELGGALTPFITAGRRIAGAPRAAAAARAEARPAPQKAATSPAPKPAATPKAEVPAPPVERVASTAPMSVIREWARTEGGFSDIPKAGILKPEVIQAYEAAQKTAQAPQPPKTTKKAGVQQAAPKPSDSDKTASPKKAKGRPASANAA